MTPTSVLVSWSAWGGTQPIFYITNHRVTGNTAWIPNPLGLTQNTSQPITGLTGSTNYDVRLQGSNTAGVAFSAVFNFTTAAGGVIFRDVVVPAEWRGPFVISRDVDVATEFRLSTFTVATNVSGNVEWTGNTASTRDAVVPLEFRIGTTFSRDVQVNIDWTGPTGVSRDFAVPVDIGSTPLAPPLQVQNLALSNPTTTSLLAAWDDLITGPPVQGYVLEWKRSTDPVGSFLVVVPSIAEPVQPFAVSRTVAVPMEYGGHVTFLRDADVPAEWGGAKGASRDFVVPVEFGGSTVRIVDASVPVEFIGSTKNVTRDFIVPHERKATSRRDTLSGVEFRATAAGPPPAAFYVESDLGDGSTITDPATGLTWGLANQSGGIATINTVPNAGSAPTDILVRTFSPDVIWIRDAAHPLLWRSWNGSGWVPVGGTSDPRYTNVAPLAVTGLAATLSSTSATLAWGFGDFTTIVGGGFLIRFKRTVDSFYGSDIIQPCVGPGIGQFVDTAGRVFSVNAAGRVVVNGTPDLTSSAVAQLLYRDSQYWYHNTSGAWFFKALVTDSWAATAASMGAGIANLLSGTSYDFQVQAFNIAGSGPNTTITQGALPGSPTGLVVVSTTSSSATLSWAPPTTGGPLDNGAYRVTTSPATATTVVPYCTPGSGSIVDAFGNTWVLAANGNPVINNNLTDTFSHAQRLLLIAGTFWQFDGSSWYNFTPTSAITSASQVQGNWAGPIATSPLTSVVIGGLAALTAYTFSVTVSNSAGTGPPATVAATIGTDTLFSDDFTSALSMDNLWATPTTTGTWMVCRDFGPDNKNGFVQNDAYQVNPFNPSTPDIDLFQTSGGNLRLSIKQTPSAQLAACQNKAYVASQIISHFSRLYGYFECRAQFSLATPGLNSAIWLYTTTPTGYYQEIDIIEFVTQSTIQVAAQALHNTDGAGTNVAAYQYSDAQSFNGSQWHTYGVNWQSDFVTFYIDRVQTAQFPTPAGYTTPMNIFVSQQQGAADWSGPITNPGALPIAMTVDYVSCWATKPFVG